MPVPLDQQFLNLMYSILGTVSEIRLTQEGPPPHFLPGKGESVYSAFLRAIGFLKYSDDVQSAMAPAQRVAAGYNVVDRLLRSKDQLSQERKQNLLNFLQGLHDQLEKYVRDVGLMRLRRIRKQIGTFSPNPRSDSQNTTVAFGPDFNKNMKLVNKTLEQYDYQKDGIGALVREIDLLNLFLSSLNAVVSDITAVQAGTTEIPLGKMSGAFVQMIGLQATNYEQRLNALIETRVSLNSELRKEQEKLRMIRAGVKQITEEPLALASIVNVMVYLIAEVKYECKECRHFSTEPAPEAAVDLSGLSPDAQKAEQAKIDAAKERMAARRKAMGEKGGYCTYRNANIPTGGERSCNDVWELVGNDYWTASDKSDMGRVDIMTKARDKLDPRKQA